MLSRRPTLLGVLLAALLCAGCGMKAASQRSAGPETSVALIVEGSAFESGAVQKRVVAALARATGRHVVVLSSAAAESSGNDLATRLARENRLARRREPACARYRDVLMAMETGADGVYRVSADWTLRSRPMTAEESAKQGTRGARLLGALGLVSAGTAVDESASGSAGMLAFDARLDAHSVAFARSATYLEPRRARRHLDAGAVIATAVEQLPPLRSPAWDAVGRKLLAARCPFLALAVSETRLQHDPHHEGLKAAALAALRGTPRKRIVSSARGRRPTSPPDVEADEPPSDASDEAPAPPPPSTETAYSCSALCGMHMVELCNRDRVLWDVHRKTWEPTPCGARRDEAFLQECYQRQWLSGVFHDSCVRPCESAPGGRERLLNILHDAGCLRSRPS